MPGYAPLQVLTGGAILTTISVYLPGFNTPQRLTVPAVAAQVTVFEAGTAIPVPVYPNSDGSGTPIPQPLTPDADGRLAGYVPQPQLIDLHITGANIQPRTITVGNLDLISGGIGVIVTDPRFGAVGDGVHDDTAAIQAALDYAAVAVLGGTGAAVAILPPGTYLTSAALLETYGTRLLGAGGRTATTIKAKVGGVFTNGSRNAAPAMLKWDGGDAWAHGCGADEIRFDTSGIAGLHATWFEAPGENFHFHNLRCDSAAPVVRTVADAQLTAGSNVVTFTASTFTEDDVEAVLTFGGAVAAPAAPTLAASGSGSTLAAGTYTVAVTYLTANGETPKSADATVTITAGQDIVISSPAALAGATGWFAYVSQAGGGGIYTRQQAPGAATAIGTNLTLTAPPTSSGAIPYRKIDRVNWATPTAYPAETTATAVTMNAPAAATLANVTVSIARPTSPFVFDMTLGGAATGRIGTLNGINNSGPLLWLKAMAQGTWLIDELSGDDNANILRISRCSLTADPANIVVAHIKAESDYYNPPWPYSHDPVVLLDRCGQLSLTILGGSFISSGYSRDVVRLDQCLQQGGPSIELSGVEGQNWYNLPFTNIIRDTTSGEALPASGYYVNAYPKVLWGRDTFLMGKSRIRRLEKRRVSVPFDTDPDWTSAGSSWLASIGSFVHAIMYYNFTAALNDGAAWLADLDAGTWQLILMGATGPDAGILSLDFAVGFIAPPATHALQANGTGSPGYDATQPFTPTGVYKTQVTYVRADGTETTPDAIVSGTINANQQLQVNAPAPADDAIGFNIYCSLAGGSTLYKQNATPQPLTTPFKVFTPSSTGAAPPTVNGTISWSSVIGTVDQYATSIAVQRPAFSNVVIPSHYGLVLVRFRITGKNASSSAYYARLSGLEAKRVA